MQKMTPQETEAHPPGPPAEQVPARASWPAPLARVWRWCSWVVLGLVFAASAVFAWTEQFSTFSEYDDEGYMMLTVRLLLDGNSLYGELKNPYGPFYFASRWLVFGLGHVPLTHDSVRLLTLVTWLTSAAMLAATVYRLAPGRWNKPWLAAAAMALSVLHLDTLKHEPGHPQEMIVPGVAALLLMATYFREDRRVVLAGLLGAISAGLCLTKANVGVFLLLACLLTLAAHSPRGRLWTVIRCLLAMAALALPCVLLREKLGTSWGVFCGSATTGLCLCLLAAYRFSPPRFADLRVWAAFLGGGASATAALLAFVLLCGGSFGGALDCLFIKATRYISKIEFPLLYEPATLAALGVSVLLALGWHLTHGRRIGAWNDLILAWFKLAAALFTVWATTSGPVRLCVYGPTWIWLVLVLPAGRQPTAGEAFFRRLLAFVALLQLLQIFPIPGSQTSVGSIALAPLALILLSDWTESMAAALPIKWGWLTRVACVAAGAYPLAMLLYYAPPSYHNYREFEPVDLPGCKLTRLPEAQAGLYRWLAENARASDVYVSRIGLNSVYFWSDSRPAGGGAVIGWSWALVNEDQQRSLVQECRKAGNVLAIYHPGVVEVFPWEQTTFGKYLALGYRPVAQFERYALLRPLAQADAPPRGCGWYKPWQLQFQRDFPQPGQTAELHLALPKEMTDLTLTRAEVQDLSSHEVLADTELAEAELHASFTKNKAGDAERILALPNGPRLLEAPLPVVRIYDHDGRPHTLVIPKFSE